MNSSNLIQEVLSSVVLQLPVVVVCIAAIVLAMTNPRKNSATTMWAILGFGLALLLCFVVPIAQSITRQWVMAQDGGPAKMAWVFSGLGFFWSILRAASYVCLLMALLAGRTQKPDPALPAGR